MPRIAARVERLTRDKIRALKPAARRYRVADQEGASVGLKLVVKPSGQKLWTCRYTRLDGQETEKVLGEWPHLLPEQARQDAAAVVTKARRDGVDPIQAQRRMRAAAKVSKAATFETWADAYMVAARAGTFSASRRPKAESSIEKDAQYLKRHILPEFGAKPVAEVGRGEIVTFIERVAQTSGFSAANSCLQVIRRTFAYARRKEAIENNPALEIQPFPTAPRDVVASDEQIRQLWACLERYISGAAIQKGSKARGDARSTALAIQFSFLTLQRRGEVACLHKDDIDWTRSVWTIPAMNKKERRKGSVPLSPWAVCILNEAFEWGASDWAFPGRDPTSHIAPKTLTRFMARLRKEEGIEDITPHDLRRTGRTKLTGEDLKVDELTAERVLNHSVGSKAQAAYDWNSYLPQKRSALEAWSNELARIVRQPKP
jgi:integrase